MAHLVNLIRNAVEFDDSEEGIAVGVLNLGTRGFVIYVMVTEVLLAIILGEYWNKLLLELYIYWYLHRKKLYQESKLLKLITLPEY